MNNRKSISEFRNQYPETKKENILYDIFTNISIVLVVFNYNNIVTIIAKLIFFRLIYICF
jgi:hypothetical protein